MKGPTEAQRLLQAHLFELGIVTVPEYQFCPDRKFRIDLFNETYRLGFECDGGQWMGGHMRGKRLESQYEKDRLAQLAGIRIFRFTNREILSGEAKAWMQEHFGDVRHCESTGHVVQNKVKDGLKYQERINHR